MMMMRIGDNPAPASASAWVGPKPLRHLGGMSDALSIATHLGFALPPPPPHQEDLQNSSTTDDRSGDLIRVLRELTTAQRIIADLQVELQGRKDDKNGSYLIHVSEMEKKCEALARITAILKEIIQNKDRLVARLQQPYSLDCISVEVEYQKQFSELLLKAASDYGALTTSVADIQWSQNFREPPTIWREMLCPIPVALASCTRFFKAMSATRETFATLQNLRVGHSSYSMAVPAKNPCEGLLGDSICVTPPQKKTSSFDMAMRSWKRRETERHEVKNESSEVDEVLVDKSQRRLSWPSSSRKISL